MRKIPAPVIPIIRAIPRQLKLEIGIDCQRELVYLELGNHRFHMTADEAEKRAADLMQFVHELRNGGRIA